MKNLFVLVFVSLLSVVSFANITPDQEYLLNHGDFQKSQLGTLVNRTRNLLVAKYSYAVQGGSTSAAISLLTDLNNKTSYATLPNKAIITNAWINFITSPTSSNGSATLALQSLSAGDLLAPTTLTLLPPVYKQGIPNGATTTFIKLTSSKTIKAVVGPTTGGSAPLSAGKFDVFIEYVLGN